MKAGNEFRVRPVKRCATPKYPTMAEIGAADLSRVPARWRRLHAVAAALGTAAMTLKAMALEAGCAGASGAESAESAPRKADGKSQSETPREAERPATDVAPIPPAALAGDGAGSFGCVAMNPPVILPESDALDIIEREFLKRGIKLVEGATLDGVLVPGPWRRAPSRSGNYAARVAAARRDEDHDWSEGFYRADVRRDIAIDFRTEDGSMMVEYVSADDEIRFERYAGYYSSVSVVRTRETAERLAKGFAARTKGKPVKVGVFYDPCAWVPEDNAVLEEAKKRGWGAYIDAKDAEGRRIAEEMLVAQIEAFFNHVGKGKTGGASDAPSH